MNINRSACPPSSALNHDNVQSMQTNPNGNQRVVEVVNESLADPHDRTAEVARVGFEPTVSGL